MPQMTLQGLVRDNWFVMVEGRPLEVFRSVPGAPPMPFDLLDLLGKWVEIEGDVQGNQVWGAQVRAVRHAAQPPPCQQPQRDHIAP
ncbi:MAG: hypothetical protein HC915_12360 [Anaerolineae bacterium]|nr:hypothetical protein [Anaerolineae bacterium]